MIGNDVHEDRTGSGRLERLLTIVEVEVTEWLQLALRLTWKRSNDVTRRFARVTLLDDFARRTFRHPLPNRSVPFARLRLGDVWVSQSRIALPHNFFH
jgi:hypothetical protein